MPQRPWNEHLLVDVQNTKAAQDLPEAYTCKDAFIHLASMPFHVETILRKSAKRQPIYHKASEMAMKNYLVKFRQLRSDSNLQERASANARNILLRRFFSWHEQRDKYHLTTVLLRRARDFFEARLAEYKFHIL